MHVKNVITLQGTNISHPKSLLMMIFLFPQVGYVSFLEGTKYSSNMVFFVQKRLLESADLGEPVNL